MTKHSIPIVLKKVKVHNLKSVDLELNHHQLIVFTGVSGSGKSSLAFDTIYVEGQRRYIESLSTYARRHLGDFKKPDAESISGLSPTIAIEQKSAGNNPRSTVGTMTGIYDFLRVLFAKVGIAHCPISKEVVTPQSASQILHKLLRMQEGTKVVILSPWIRGKKGSFKEEFSDLSRKGYTRVRLDGKLIELDEEISLDSKQTHTLDLVIDRIVIRQEEKNRIAEAVNQGLEKGQGLLTVLNIDTGDELFFSQHASSKKSGLSYPPLEPSDFSFNHPLGMCEACQGLGGDCPSCQGGRLRPYPAATTIGGKTIAEVTKMGVADSLQFFAQLCLSEQEMLIAEELLKEIKERLYFLKDVGLHYLSLDRTAPTLSGGEAQRVRLACQIGSGLVGATYVLDEPSIGLHPRDNVKLIGTLQQLKRKGNTVIVVEHDEETIAAADTIIDVGPLAGEKGGKIVFQGDIQGLLKCKESITGAYLSGKRSIPIPKRRKPSSYLTLKKASHHNLKHVDFKLPLSLFVAVTGVSGSGKSSLITDTLYPALANHLHRAELLVGKHQGIEGIEALDKVIAIDQTPIGRTPRSNPATFIKVFDEIRDLFAELPESRAQGYKPGRFSFNVKEGSCCHCQGMGMVKIDMDFMEDEWIPCEHCQGKRFDTTTLSVLYKGKSIHDILEMTIEEALTFFSPIPSIHTKLATLKEVGLEYMRLGQPSPTLSGGEAQRIKLAKELCRPSTGKTLYILDEPTTGLHFYDIEHLIQILQKLVDKGNTVLVIEHNMDLVKTADWVIDLGPDGGDAGGYIIASGTPEMLVKEKSPTAEALVPYLKKIPITSHAAPALSSPTFDAIYVEGASQNNLKSLDLSIPRGKITVCTGPSGSGKSSFAFETLYAEGQRRYIESMSAYARQFVKQSQKPKVDLIEGLSPAIAIEQKNHAGNPRSTVGTMTESYDFLRILYAHLGIAHCPETGTPLRTVSKQFILNQLLELPSQTKVQLLSPVTLQESFEEFKESMQRKGFLRIRLNGTYYELDQEIPFDKQMKNALFLVIDRFFISKDQDKRILSAIDQATTLAKGTCVAALDGEDLFFNLSFTSIATGKSYPEITPHTFSFNTESGMCPECEGLGFHYGIDLRNHPRMLNLSFDELLSLFFKEHRRFIKWVTSHFKKKGIPFTVPLSHLEPHQQMLLLDGDVEGIEKEGMILNWKGFNRLTYELALSKHSRTKEYLLPYYSKNVCSACQGDRLHPLARHVILEGLTLPALCRLPVDDALIFLDKLTLNQQHAFLEEVLSSLKHRLLFLKKIGVGYLSLERSAPTLSGGETQRIRLARQLGSGLTGCLYVLDEPTIGLHPFDNEKLNLALKHLSSLGNTLVLVEHDPLTVALADHIIDFGPKAGKNGGRIVAEGSYQEICNNPASLTGAYLSCRKSIPIPTKRRSCPQFLELSNACLHNLKNIDVKIPIKTLTCLSGVSGSGKSTLLADLLEPAATLALKGKRRGQKGEETVVHKGAILTGMNHFDKLIVLSQNPMGHTQRADVSTYADLMTPLRYYFAALPEAVARGLSPRYFSFNHRRGMCTHCRGLGYRHITLQFLPSVKVVCESCQGFRLNPLSLTVKTKEKHLGHILQMTVEEALAFLPPIPKAVHILETLISVGLGYLTLGQEIASLSGGEAQRLRLSKELAKRSSGKTLYLLDEPTVGLHPDDIAKLLPIFHSLVDQGNTLVIIEHNLDILKNADHLIDIGPLAAEKGGKIVATGTPEEVALHPTSHTAPYLKASLDRS
ncbi:MAG: uvrABC system protein [Chlamydiota bacterium]|jgi:excinuclease ABC subunit A